MTREFEKFQEWLLKTKKFTKKSAGDVCSRIRRVDSLLGVQGNISSKLIFSRLEESRDFMKLSVFVKSQLKRAVQLLSDFEK